MQQKKEKMNKMRIAIWALATLLMCACTHKRTPQVDELADSLSVSTMVGDSAIYGLACDGCTDSVIVLLPAKGGDPVTYDILHAMKQRKVIGRPKIGDNLAVMLNPENPKEAISVVDIDELKGSWVYLVMPKLREGVKQMASNKDVDALSDSVINSLMVPREYGFKLKRDYQASPIGMTYRSATTDDESPVVYPPLKRYREWHVFNGKLILAELSAGMSGKKAHVLSQDTAEIVFMMKDSLQLRFKDETRNYYRQQEK